MKVLYIDLDTEGALTVAAGADSAVLRPGEPVFVPEPTSDWRSAVAPAIRISRLGTAIRAKRAQGYYDSISAVHVLTPAHAGVCPGLPPFVLDRAVSPGRWLPTSDHAGHCLSLAAQVRSIADERILTEASVTFPIESLRADVIIEEISRHITFRTGDILIFGFSKIDLGAPALDTALTATVGGDEVISIRIK